MSAADKVVKDLKRLMEEAGDSSDDLLAEAKQKDTLTLAFTEVLKPPYEGWELKSDNGKMLVGTVTLELFEVLQEGDGDYISGDEMMKRAQKLGVDWNQKTAEFLLTNQHLIPESWRGYYIIFPGTVWQGSDGCHRVPYLHWRGRRWALDFYWLGYDWGEDDRFLCLSK